ncbi:NUDIX hydrolase [Frankia gtarii]|uniref:NUDIX hydrolase n=1 Tax=Frankia gtarii TaxID=2950102 RepID=UPI0021C1B8C9|nr:NUDIX domain-containing protein [Frankia gtarii]
MIGRNLEPLATDDDGNILLAFHPAGDDIGVRDAPLTVSLVALWHDGRMLLVFNRQRACWELPGGMIDPGETPRQAAIRELHEESGYQLDDLTFAGYARFVLGPEQRAEYAAIYTGRATPANAFDPNDEITAIIWWDGASPLADRVQPLDVCLGRLARAALR